MKEINIDKQKSKEIFLILSRGQFLSFNTDNERENTLYKHLLENKESYKDLFGMIGVSLVEGNGYFYFASVDTGRYENKLKSYQELLLIVDFLKIFDSNIGIGYTFRSTDITNALVANKPFGLISSMEKILNNKDFQASKGVDYVLNRFEKLGFIQKEGIGGINYKALSAFAWINELYELIKINE